MIGNRLQQNIKNHKLSTWVEEVDTDGHRTASLCSSSKFVAEFVEPGSLPIALTPKTKKPPFGALHFESTAFLALALREGLMLAALRAANTPNGAASLRSSSKFVAEFVEPGSHPGRPHPKNQKNPFRGSSLRINSIFGGERGIDACGLAGRKHP